MWHARAALLVLLAVAWNADVEGLPVRGSDVGHASLGETTMQPVGGGAPVIRTPPRTPVKDPNVPQNAQTRAAEASVAGAQAKVDAALAQVNGAPPPTNPRVAAAAAGQPLPSTPGLPEARDMRDPSAVKNAQPVTVRTPNINPDSLVDHETTLVKPPPEEYLNRFLKPGDDGYVAQQAEEPIYTANHQLHHINLKLQLDRDRKYDVARGSKEVLLAAEAGSAATADMANAVREQVETDVAQSEAKIRNIKDEIAEHQFKDKAQHAKLQLTLVREQKKHAGLLARAKTMGDAVNVAINKAGDIEGRARAQYNADMDPQMELAEAIVDAAQAKMALDEHDKRVAQENKEAAEDEKQKKYFAKVQKKGEKALEKIEADGEKAKQAQEEADYQADIAAAAKAQQASMTVGTVTVPANMAQTMSEEDITEEEKQKQVAQKKEKQNSPGVVPAPKNDKQATADMKMTVEKAHATGRPEDAAAAQKAIDDLKAVKNAKTPTQTVDEMTKQSNDLAKMANNIKNDKPTEPVKPTSTGATPPADASASAPAADAPAADAPAADAPAADAPAADAEAPTR